MTSVLKRVTAAVLKIGKNDPLPNAPVADPGNSGQAADAAHVHRSPKITTARWHGATGYGSVATKIPVFINEREASNNEVVSVTNNSTNGFSIVANMRCKLNLTYTVTFNQNHWFGISRNCLDLSISTTDLSPQELVAIAVSTGAGYPMSTSYSGILEVGDIIRPHTNGVTLSTFQIILFTAEEIFV